MSVEIWRNYVEIFCERICEHQKLRETLVRVSGSLPLYLCHLDFIFQIFQEAVLSKYVNNEKKMCSRTIYYRAKN